MKTNMIRSLMLSTLLVCGFGAAATAVEPAIVWSRNVYESCMTSIDSGKPLIVYFTQSNCGWCRRLEQDVFNAPEMVALAGKAEFVWADIADEDDKGNYAQLRQDLKIDKYPTMVVLDTATVGIRERGRIVGYFRPEEFVGNLNQILPSPAAPAVVAEPTR